MLTLASTHACSRVHRHINTHTHDSGLMRVCHAVQESAVAVTGLSVQSWNPLVFMKVIGLHILFHGTEAGGFCVAGFVWQVLCGRFCVVGFVWQVLCGVAVKCLC